MSYGKKIVLKNAQKIEIFSVWIFFGFFGPGDHNSDPILQKLVSFCWKDQMPSLNTNFSPIATPWKSSFEEVPGYPNTRVIACQKRPESAGHCSCVYVLIAEEPLLMVEGTHIL